MIGDKRNFNLTIWDHEDNYLCSLKSNNINFKGQSFNENFIENVSGEKTLTFSIPMYIFDNTSSQKYEKTTEKQYFIQNEAWRHIYNEQKIRYTEYDEYTNKPTRIEDFVLKNYIESREGEQKIANCTCEHLAVYELGKVGWNINFDTDYITNYEQLNTEDLLTLDYWLRKIFYKETNLGRVSTTTECTYLLQGLQMRNEDGAPINSEYSIDEEGNYIYQIIDEPIATTSDVENYKNEAGWSWEVQADFKNNPFSISTTTVLYEEPVIDRYIEVAPNQYKAFSYQKRIGTEDSSKTLQPYPITEEGWQYVTSIKRSLFHTERSNIYSIIQELCEVFKIWAYFQYEYNDSGKIISRNILFKTEGINEDIKFDFSYGKNLINCQRNSDSNELVTKLIVPDTESTLDSGNILSIKQATANPTGEGYLYNFQYFYETGMLTSGEDNISSDEYKINLHSGKIKNYNKSIVNLQNYLVPLYNRRTNLQSELTIQEGSKTAIIGNMQSIQDKIDAIPIEQRIINSWSEYNSQYNHIGELKTITTTTVNGVEKYYIDFGREDIIYNQVEYTVFTINNNDQIVEGSTSTLIEFKPRYFKNTTWITGTTIDDNDTTNFILLDNNKGTPVFSTIRDKQPGFIKGFYLDELPSSGQTFVRVRYKYAPLIWYYMLIKDYWEQLIEVEENIKTLKNQLQEINNKIVTDELNLNNLLNQKNEEILQFEKKYKPYIREGYWEPSNYQAQIAEKQLDTNNPSNFEGLVIDNYRLNELNLNESLNNYTYFIDLDIAASGIDINSISMITKNPALGLDNTSTIPRYRGNDYEVYLDNDNKIILGIAPSLIDTYIKYGYTSDFWKSYISYSTSSGNSVINAEYNWVEIIESNNPTVQEKYIYLTNDNILTSSIKVYGNSINNDNLLEVYKDYDYTFDYAGYDSNGIRVDLDEQTSYSTDITYDYITKIILKNTNNVNKYNHFIVTYNEEATLQYLYQDAVRASKKYAVPQITYSVNIIDISSLQDYKNYKPIVGQKVPIYDKEMGFNGFEGFITSVSKELESPENTQITIATYTSRFEDVFQKLTATMTDIRYNQNEIFNAADSFTSDGTIKINVFQKSLDNNNFQIQLGVNNDITIDKKTGITLIDQDNNSAVKIIGNGIFLTEEYNGDSSQWKTGITGEGINAGALIAGNIDTKNINIWNASEGQIRFIWNEQGLSAYSAKGVSGTSTGTAQDFVDYNKFVRFNYDGLDFSDNGKSALKLGWSGLSIQTQQGALTLDADNGLVLKNGNTKRLELGKLIMNGNTLYGLRLYDTSGSPTFQSDSNGDLWLAKHIKVGGDFNGSTYTNRPTAGIVGIQNSSERSYQMGVMRDTSSGDIIWKDANLRFYAGPQTKTNYLANLSMSVSDLSGNVKTYFDSLSDYDPALSRFKVDSEGNIVASGIDVGGWIGAGKILRSKDFEAILRSGDYSDSAPVLAIGKYNTTVDGSNYNFRVFQDGSINIGRGQFTVSSAGAVVAQNINISGNNTTITGGSIGGLNITGTSLTYTSGNYTTGIYKIAGTTDKAFVAGLTNNPAFKVDGQGNLTATSATITGTITSSNATITGGSITISGTTGNAININSGKFLVTKAGAVTASDITITGSGSRNWIINSSEFQVDKNGQIGASIIPTTQPTTFNYNNYNFSVTSDGNIRFRGTISAYYSQDNNWYTGLDQEIIEVDVKGPDGTTVIAKRQYRVVKGLIVSREYKTA